MENKTQHGYLVLADISGYTSYLATTELEHAQEILTELLELIVSRFQTVLTLSKLEGDAVFAYTPDAKMQRGETLLELVESTYTAFRDRREAAHRRTTCTCNACRNIPSLDLKFLVHHGDYIIQTVSGINELVGSDVNLIHRLLKNHVAEATGWRAYALFTEAALAHVGIRPEGLREQPEAYEHLGEIQTHSLNLHPHYAALIEARRVFITPAEADLVLIQDFAAPPVVVWDWLNDPPKRTQWDHAEKIVDVLRPGGRVTAGARNHCIHGKYVAVETILDWRPFEYFTVEILERSVYVYRTCHLAPSPDGNRTRLATNFKARLPMPAWLNRRLAKPFLKMIKVAEVRAAMEPLVAREMARREAEVSVSVPVAA